jgi:hypothetical protein
MDLSQCILSFSDAVEVRVGGDVGSRRHPGVDFCKVVGRRLSAFECGSWRWYQGVVEVHINKGGVGEDRGG